MDSLGAIAQLKELRQTLVSDLVMARIPVTSQRSAFRIFETLNDRGLRLSAPDLLLNYLMGTAPDNEQKDIRDLWTEMIQRMGRHDINLFLRHMWISKYGDLKKEDLFTALSAHIEEHHISSLDFARTCADECENYVQIITVEEAEIGRDAAPYLRALVQELNFQPAFPLLLSAYRRLQPSDFVDVAKWLLVFITRYSIIGNRESSGMEDLLFSLAREIRNAVSDSNDTIASKRAAQHIKQMLAKNAPDSEAIKKDVEELVFDRPAEAKYVVGRLARYKQSPTKETALGETNLEHIYPQNPDPNEWGGEANQTVLNPLVWHIGNLTFFGKKANRKAANNEYSVKRPRYEKSELTMTQDIARDYNDWNEKTIRNRAKTLAKSVVEVWDFNNPSRV
ncbi:MAG: HNH endonuclease family protein [Syntrophales bacterium]|jgi:hypothetical protein